MDHNRASASVGDARQRPDRWTAAGMLRLAADDLEKPGAWAQGAEARAADGSEAWADSERAVSFGVVAALWRQAPEAVEELHKAYVALISVTGAANLVRWNDAPGRTQAEVVDALRKAADLADGALEASRTTAS